MTISIISHAYAIADRTTFFKLWYQMVNFSPHHDFHFTFNPTQMFITFHPNESFLLGTIVTNS